MKDTNLPAEPPTLEGDDLFRAKIGVATKFIQKELFIEAKREKDPRRKEELLNCHLTVSQTIRKII